MDNAIENIEVVTLPDPQSWIERLVGVFLSPSETFRQIKAENQTHFTGVLGALVIVLFVFTLDGARLGGANSSEGISWGIPMALILGFSYWLGLSGMLAIAASSFGGSPQSMRSAFVSLGWSFAPWMLTGPITCYAHATGVASILSGVPYIWVFVLQYIAMMESFDMKWWQAALLIFIAPILLSFVQVVQFVQSCWSSFTSFS